MLSGWYLSLLSIYLGVVLHFADDVICRLGFFMNVAVPLFDLLSVVLYNTFALGNICCVRKTCRRDATSRQIICFRDVSTSK